MITLLSLFLSQAWRPTWSPAGRWSHSPTAAALRWGWPSMRILIAPLLLGCTHLTELLQQAPSLLKVLRWAPTFSEIIMWNISCVVEEVSIFVVSSFGCLRKNTELHVLLQPLWCSSFSLSMYFCVCGCIRSFDRYFSFLFFFFACKELPLRTSGKEKEIIESLWFPCTWICPCVSCNYTIVTVGTEPCVDFPLRFQYSCMHELPHIQLNSVLFI